MKRQRGQALILVLIFLALGALTIVPILRLTGDILKSSQRYVQFSNEDYAANAALEYGLWRLNWEPGYARSLPMGVESEPFCVTLNGVTAWTTITPQATPGDLLYGQDLMKDKVSYQAVKGVSPETANVMEPKEFTYTVNFRCYDPDTPPLEEVTDSLARGLVYVAGSTSWDTTDWGIAPFEPEKKWKDKPQEQYWELKWKFKDKTRLPLGAIFEYGETKSMNFRVSTAGLAEGVYGNEIDVKPGEKDLGAYQAPIIVGDPEYVQVPRGFLDINKTVDKEVIYPNEPTTVTYTITLTNVDLVPVLVRNLIDWLPTSGIADPNSPATFHYVPNSTTATITHADLTTTDVPMPDTYPDAKNILEQKWKDKSDQLRWELKWNLENHQDARFDPIILEPLEFVTMMFSANATLEASGVYFDEFLLDNARRYPIEVVTVMNPELTNPPEPNPVTVHHTVTMENLDVWSSTIERVKAWLPSTDTGVREEAFQYKANSTKINGVAKSDKDAKVTKSEWDGKKGRWRVEWDIQDVTLSPGQVLTMEFDSTVNPSDPWLTFNELLWEAVLKNEREDEVDLYSFPTAGTMVPMYDLEVETLSSILKSNAWLGYGHHIHPKSVHWDKHR